MDVLNFRVKMIVMFEKIRFNFISIIHSSSVFIDMKKFIFCTDEKVG